MKFVLLLVSFSGYFTHLETLWKVVKWSMKWPKWECFVPDTPSFCHHMYMVMCGALQWNFSHKMMLVHLKVPYYRAFTLSSNVSINCELKTFKASLYSSEKHFLFDNVLLMNRRLAIKVFKIVKETSVSCIINLKAPSAFMHSTSVYYIKLQHEENRSSILDPFLDFFFYKFCFVEMI